jgi:hypothetical protein
VNQSNDLERLFLWIVHNPVIPIGLQHPEAQRQGRQVFSKTASEGRARQHSAGVVDGCFDAIRRIDIIGCKLFPDFEEVFDGLRRELITAHAWRFSVSQARFLSSSLVRTSPESIKSPRCAAA